MKNDTKPTMIILLGPPGSGKGTQAAILAKRLNIPHISTGDLFRMNIAEKTPLGLEAKKYIDAGKLGPDQLVLDMLWDRLAKNDCANGCILDGFPRTISQAVALDEKLHSSARLLVISLSVPDSVILQRMTGRLTCRNCGTIYHKVNSPPKKANICDKCQGELYQRSDDQEQVILTRLQVYRDQTEPLIKYYQDRNLLRSFDANKLPDVLLEEIVRSIH